jgi:hypothetical protein
MSNPINRIFIVIHFQVPIGSQTISGNLSDLFDEDLDLLQSEIDKERSSRTVETDARNQTAFVTPIPNAGVTGRTRAVKGRIRIAARPKNTMMGCIIQMGENDPITNRENVWRLI